MKHTLTILIILIFALASFGQAKKNGGPDFDIADFNKKMEVAEWLVEYDLVAWKTTDVVVKEDKAEIAKLGREWFCFQDEKGIWHAVYGKYADGKYRQVFHYTVGTDSKITKTDKQIDADFLNLHGRALATANKEMLSNFEKTDGLPRFNQYIRQNSDQTFDVWLFPGFQPNGYAVYGAEFIYTIDKTGSKILKDESYMQENLRGFKTGNPREIWLKYTETEEPTLGAIFFVWYYKPYFTKINLETSESISWVTKLDKLSYSWIHIEKQKAGDKKK